MRVLFLGAGASKALGLPLTSELLPLCVSAARKKKLFDNSGNPDARCKQFLEMLSCLIPGYSENDRLPLITDLLSLIDYSLAESITILPSGGLPRLRQYRNLIEVAIVEIIAKQKQNREKTEILGRILSSTPSAIITTNYDLTTDFAISKVFSDRTAKGRPGETLLDAGPAHKVDYGMPWRDPVHGSLFQRPSDPQISLFKIHGSVNWLGCPHCEHVYINTDYQIGILDDDRDTIRYGYDVTCHCGYAPLKRVIISPSLARSSYPPLLRFMQLAALEAIRTAEQVDLIGYSLPSEDLFVRSLLLRGLSGPDRAKCAVSVYQASEEARPRYAMLLKDFEYHTTGFDGYIEANKC